MLITLDTTRADHLSTYGYARPTDPFLASLARRSLVYENAITPATWTLPSHVSIFTGLDPVEHGCWSRATHDGGGASVPTPSEELPFFTARLKAAGYLLIGAAGGPFTSARYGLARDFDAYLDPGDAFQLSGAALNDWIFDQLDARQPKQPLFLFVNYFDAHAPYDPPAGRHYPFPAGVGDLEPVPELHGPQPPELAARARDQYDRELLVQDEAVAALIGRLREDNLLDDALLVITADHGEMFGEQPNVFGHGCTPFEPVARVPLLLQRLPDGPVGRRGPPVSTANIAATLLTAAGLDPLPSGGGRPRFDLLAALPARPLPPYTEHHSAEEWIGALRGPRYKYAAVLGPKDSPRRGWDFVIDLQSNPDEHFDQLVPLPTFDQLDAFRNSIYSLFTHWRAPPADQPLAVLPEEERARLEELGYF